MSADTANFTAPTATATATATATTTAGGSAALGDAAFNPRGIPKAEFLENIESHVQAFDSPEAAIGSMETNLRNYRNLEVRLSQRRHGLERKVPDIVKSLDALRELASKDEGQASAVDFELVEHVYVRAKVKKPQNVCLWLGANVMLEYSFAEAQTLLENNLAGARKKLQELEEDLDFLKEQTTTTEVNRARLINHAIKIKRGAAKNAAS